MGRRAIFTPAALKLNLAKPAKALAIRDVNALAERLYE
jgi:hypothetical protein